jgi:uncharacterized protein YwgA
MTHSANENSMKARDIVLHVIWRCEGRPEFGRTSLQKVMYFIGRRLNVDLGHRAYFYGPFASTIERETETLVLSKLVEEHVSPLGFIGPGGFPAKRFSYTLTSAGHDRVREVEKKHPDHIRIIDEVLDGLLHEAKGLDQRVLSAAAKVDYIAKQEGRSVSVDDVIAAAKDLGWSIRRTQAQFVVGLLGNLGFVKVVGA